MCLELPEFVGFSLSLKPILDRDSEHWVPLGTAHPSCATAQPGGILPHRSEHALGWGSSRSCRLPGCAGLDGRAGVLREKARAGQCKKSAAAPVGRLLGQRGCTPQMCRALPLPWAHCTMSFPDVVGSSCPHQQQTKKSPNCPPLSHRRMLMAPASDE